MAAQISAAANQAFSPANLAVRVMKCSRPRKLGSSIQRAVFLMNIEFKIICSLLAAFVVASSTLASAREPIEGVWKNRPNTLLVKIAPCGDSLCGTVIGAAQDAKESVRKEGTANLIGTRVLTGLRKAPDGSYRGAVFNPNLNIHASGTVTLVSQTVLLVRGCVLAGLICRQQHWNRVS